MNTETLYNELDQLEAMASVMEDKAGKLREFCQRAKLKLQAGVSTSGRRTSKRRGDPKAAAGVLLKRKAFYDKKAKTLLTQS